jgi:hypothetical protein
VRHRLARFAIAGVLLPAVAGSLLLAAAAGAHFPGISRVAWAAAKANREGRWEPGRPRWRRDG